MKNHGFRLSQFDEIKYNACDAPGFERGDMGKGKPKTARIYSIYRIDPSGLAYCQSRSIFGGLYNEVFPVSTLLPWEKS